MKMDTASLKSMIGQRLYWVSECNRWSFKRSGVLTDVYRNMLEFDNNQDYQPLSYFKNLTTEEHKYE